MKVAVKVIALLIPIIDHRDALHVRVFMHSVHTLQDLTTVTARADSVPRASAQTCSRMLLSSVAVISLAVVTIIVRDMASSVVVISLVSSRVAIVPVTIAMKRVVISLASSRAAIVPVTIATKRVVISLASSKAAIVPVTIAMKRAAISPVSRAMDSRAISSVAAMVSSVAVMVSSVAVMVSSVAVMVSSVVATISVAAIIPMQSIL